MIGNELTGMVPPSEPDFERLGRALTNAIRKIVPAGEKVGIAFSGGLDSGVLAWVAREGGMDIQLIVCGTAGSHDVSNAIAYAKDWGLSVSVETLTGETIRNDREQVKRILQTEDRLQTMLGGINLAMARRAHAEGLTHVIVGTGADAIFAGFFIFQKYRDDDRGCEQVRAEKMETLQGLDIPRENACAREYQINLHAPYMDPIFMEEALKISAIRNLQGKYGPLRKGVLRELAERMRVPEAIVRAPKKAMQYGSGVSKIVGGL
ncbi:MAG: asparagine synthase-related protein [Candidatus Diapherotrites archaeon]|nr:asparagine synthase-related protein [Candidatus Diapherotrites archaeon]MDZ4256600.1 asparagine synthase-related protein [archaeon]